MNKLILPLLIFQFSFIFLFPQKIYSATEEIVVLSEDFSGDLSNWRIVNDSHLPPCPDNSWMIENERLVAKMVGSCTSNLLPLLGSWDKSITEFSIEMDMWFISGKDHNLLYRYYDFENDDLNSDDHTRLSEFHFHPKGTNPTLTKISLAGIPESTTKNYQAITPNKSGPYKMRVEFKPGSLNLYIDEVHIINHLYTSGIGSFPPSEFGIRAGSGTGLSETHFDNVRVTREVEVPDVLDVPYFSQLDPEWKDEIYGNTDKSIGYLGCTLTSSAMLLRYHGIDTIPGTSDTVTPLTLNGWLVDHEGYDTNGRLVYTRLSSLATQYISENPTSFSHSSMEVNSARLPIQNIYDYLGESINTDENPVLVKLKNPISPSKNHFFVGRGVLETGLSYSILDPIDIDNNVSEIPPDEYKAVVGLIPSNSDHSYLVIHTDESLRFSIIDPENNENGDIEKSVFGLDYPATNYLEPDDPSVPTIWEFEQKYPSPGNYSISLEVDIDDFYNVWLMSTDKDGNYYLYSKWLYLMSDYPTTLYLTNDPDDSNNSEISVEYGYLENDPIMEILDNLFEGGHIKSKGFLRSLKNHIKFYFKFIDKKPRISYFSLDIFEKRVNHFSPRFIDEKAKEVLLSIADQLR